VPLAACCQCDLAIPVKTLADKPPVAPNGICDVQHFPLRVVPCRVALHSSDEIAVTPSCETPSCCVALGRCCRALGSSCAAGDVAGGPITHALRHLRHFLSPAIACGSRGYERPARRTRRRLPDVARCVPFVRADRSHAVPAREETLVNPDVQGRDEHHARLGARDSALPDWRTLGARIRRVAMVATTLHLARTADRSSDDGAALETPRGLTGG
jgi:hypothetical protein